MIRSLAPTDARPELFFNTAKSRTNSVEENQRFELCARKTTKQSADLSHLTIAPHSQADTTRPGLAIVLTLEELR